MPSIVPDLLRHLGGVPVASAGNFAGWWGRKIWFSDFDNGTTGAYGNDMLKPQKNLATILNHSDFGPGDGVFIKPASPSQTGYVGDPTPITPATAVNWVIAAQDYGVSLIGTGIGLPGPGSGMTRLQGHASVTASPTLDARAPYVNLENLGFRRGGSTSGIVRLKYTDSSTLANSTYHSFGSSITNCHFRLADAAGGLVLDSAWYTKLSGVAFSSCRIGIKIDAINSVPVGVEIGPGVLGPGLFEGTTGEIDANIFSSGAVTRISIHDLVMNHAVPAYSGGSYVKYIYFSAASTGLVANISTGAVDPTVADNMTLNGVLYSNIWGDGVGPFVDA